MKIEEILQKFDLSENEVNTYVALLGLGRGTVQEVAKKSGIKRVTTHVILDRLEQQGLVRFVTHDKKRYAIPESPEKLKDFLDRETKELEERKEEFGKILPKLLKTYNLTQGSPIVQFYEGYEGLQALKEQLLNIESKQVASITSLDDLFTAFPKHQKQHTPVRVKRNIKGRLLYTHSKGPVKKLTDKKLLREARFIPSDKFPFESDINIFDNKISLASLKGEMNGVIIQSKEIAETMRSMFELAWKAAETFEENN